VTTGAWTVVHCLGVAMSLLNLLGVVGIHARQADRAGLLGVAGSVLFGSFWALRRLSSSPKRKSSPAGELK
jgi:hypothetical protein